MTLRERARARSIGKLHALTIAVEALVGAGMTSEARPLLGQLRGIVEAARGPFAQVIDLAVARSKLDP